MVDAELARLLERPDTPAWREFRVKLFILTCAVALAALAIVVTDVSLWWLTVLPVVWLGVGMVIGDTGG